MKKLLLSFLVISTATIALAQNTINDSNAEKRTTGSFHGIDVGTGIELTLIEGNAEEIAVSASTTEFRDKIVTKVENGILKIYYENKLGSVNKRNETKNLKAYVSYKTLDMLNANTGAEVIISGVLKAESFVLNANTGALVNGEVDIKTFKISQNTGSKITLSGKTDKLEIDGDTGSKFKGEDMNTFNCNVTVSTGAGVYINVQKELNIKANTGGFVKYKGTAGIRDVKTHTGGSVSKI